MDSTIIIIVGLIVSLISIVTPIIKLNNNSFHDRYIVLDKKEVYVSGMSLKDIGKKYSYIYKINEPLFINELIKRIDNIIDK